MFWRFFVLLLTACLSVGSAAAQTYPNRPITLVISFPAGGATDALARPVVEAMSQALGQQIVIEYVGGAGGALGAARVARAAPDGYTIMIHQAGLAIAMALNPKLTFDAAKDFDGIGMMANIISLMVGSGKLSPDTLQDLVRWMKEPNNTARMAHPGVGSFGHLCLVTFVQETGTKVDYIPYRGGGVTVADLIGGHADLSILSAAGSSELVKAGKLKGYGVFGHTRFAGLPELPHFVEAGYPRLDLPYWQALFAPAGTPRPIIERLNTALREALAQPKVREALARSGIEPYPESEQTPEATMALLRSEIKRWSELARNNNIAVQQ